MLHDTHGIIPALACALLATLAAPSAATAEPVEVSSPPLRQIRVSGNRTEGRLVVHTNFASHQVSVDGAEYPAYLDDIGIDVTSNEVHEVRVSNGKSDRVYRISVEPGETFALYVDLGAAPKQSAKADDKQQNKKDDAASGYLSITAETEAQIYIDGKLIAAKTPLKKYEVTPGSHTVRVYFFDGRKFSKSREVYVGRGATMSLNFTKD